MHRPDGEEELDDEGGGGSDGVGTAAVVSTVGDRAHDLKSEFLKIFFLQKTKKLISQKK